MRKVRNSMSSHLGSLPKWLLVRNRIHLGIVPKWLFAGGEA